MKAFLALLKTLLSAVWTFVNTSLLTAYGVLKLLRIRLLALYVLVCFLVNLIWHPFQGTWLILFWVGLALCAAATLLSWTVTLAGRKQGGAEKRPEKERTEKRPEKERPQKKARPTPPPPSAPPPPRYFEVEGHPGYYFAEYDDRYELYLMTEYGARLVRIDEKTEQRYD